MFGRGLVLRFRATLGGGYVRPLSVRVNGWLKQGTVYLTLTCRRVMLVERLDPVDEVTGRADT